MRIIGGQASGIVLTVPRGIVVRPTAAVSRKALFDSIGNFQDLTVVDLFSGSGALGLEAASRGASKVCFVEESSRTCSVISENILKVSKAGVNAGMEVFRGNSLSVHRLLSSLGKSVDLVFADPPYSDSAGLMAKMLADANFAEWVEGAVLIWELPEQKNLMPDIGGIIAGTRWKVTKRRYFGRTEFVFLKN